VENHNKYENLRKKCHYGTSGRESVKKRIN